MVRKAFLFATGISAALIATAPQASAQQGAPRVRVTSHYSSFSTIAPSVSLSEPSYMLAIAIDRDGQVTVLSPVGPDDIFRFNAEKSLRLPEFFSGFSNASSGYYGSYRNYRNASYIRSMTDDYSAGSVLVLASRTPFNFSAITDGPFWNEDAIKKLVRYRDPSSAVYALGRAVTAKGQSFGHDFQRFGASRYQVASADPCSGWGFSPYGYANFSGIGGYSTFNGLRGNGYVIVAPTATTPGLQMVSIGTDACGRIRYVVVPIRILPPTDLVPVDSTNMPKPATKTIATAPGTYYGEEAVRVFEMVKNRNSSDTYVGLPMSPILKEKEDGPLGRPVTRNASPPERVETFERVRSATPTPIERAPILRQEEPRQFTPVSQPIMRAEPVIHSAPTVQREAKPAEVTSGIKDN